jgi:DNA replication and repair protein RecF
VRKAALNISAPVSSGPSGYPAASAGATHASAAPGQPRVARGAPGFSVDRLTLSEFRSYPALRLETGPGPLVLTGANGAGKTNLLEAVSFLAPGRGLRRARLADVARRMNGADPDNGGMEDGAADTKPWAVAARISGPNGAVEIGTGRDTASLRADGEAEAAPGGERRAVRIDGAAAPGQSALARVVSIAWLTPEMDRLFVGPASGRRRFLDRLVYGFVPDHAARVAAYERALRERSRLLREGRADADWLAALETAMAESGTAVAAARRDVVARLSRAVDGDTGPFPRPALVAQGTVEDWLDEVPAVEAEDRLRAALAASRPQDAHSGGAAEGPHKSDLRVRHVAKNMPAEMCSTGEQKALLVALILAVARLQAVERGAPPILLLDEIAAHLDDARRAALFDSICALGAQVWMTGTEAALFAPLRGRARFFTVAGGQVAPDAGER